MSNNLTVSVSSKQRALFAAVRKAELEIVRALTEAGVSVNFSLPSQPGHIAITPLMLACFKGYSEMVRYLLDHGAIVEATDELDNTALYYAVRSNQNVAIDGIVSCLLEHGADPNHKIRANWGNVFVASIRKGQAQTIQRLLAAGAKVNSESENMTSPLIEAANVGDDNITSLLLANGANVNYRGIGGRTALMTAADNGFVRVVELLIEWNADPNASDENGSTALTLAANRVGDCFDETEGQRYLEVIKLLVKSGVHMNVLAPNGWTPLD
ncbi:MAG TPA: hypothetical protein DCE44_04895, partial [Verrucomicrobiales bacterium]|nr:hypothetical protein [Verrucomicrobiales bacterium]